MTEKRKLPDADTRAAQVEHISAPLQRVLDQVKEKMEQKNG